jgi:hypothetical protein
MTCIYNKHRVFKVGWPMPVALCTVNTRMHRFYDTHCLFKVPSLELKRTHAHRSAHASGSVCWTWCLKSEALAWRCARPWAWSPLSRCVCVCLCVCVCVCACVHACRPEFGLEPVLAPLPSLSEPTFACILLEFSCWEE